MSQIDLLDYFAGIALQGILASNLEPAASGSDVAELAYVYAKHMLDARALAINTPYRAVAT